MLSRRLPGRAAGLGSRRIVLPMGQCRLTKSGANLLLSRFDGRYVFINGRFEQIPSAGVTLAPTALPVDTTFYIYAFMSSGAMTLEAVVTTPADDATYGHRIKTGDGTRSLVGMARTITGPAWEDTTARRFVLSHFNRTNKHIFNVGSSSTASTTFVELSTAARGEFLCWVNEAVELYVRSNANNSAAGQSTHLALYVDGAQVDTNLEAHYNAPTGGYQTNLAVWTGAAPAEGYHYVSAFGRSGAAGTSTFSNLINSGVVRG